MGEALTFASVELASPQGLFCSLSFSDILDGAEHFIRPSRSVPPRIGPAMHRAHFSIRTNDPMFCVCRHSGEKGLLCLPEHRFSIFRVDHFSKHRYVDGTFLRRHPINTIGLVRPGQATRLEVPVPVSDVGDSLSFFKPGVTVLEAA